MSFTEWWPCPRCDGVMLEGIDHVCAGPFDERVEDVAPIDAERTDVIGRWYAVAWAAYQKRGCAVYVPIQALIICGRVQSCGGACCLFPLHVGECECAGCAPGEPDTCPA